MDNYYYNKSIFITGICGTVGKELLRQVIMLGPKEVIGIDNNESELFYLSEEFKNFSNVNLYIGDIRDPAKLMRKMRNIDVVLHTAALKHVILCERSPRDPVQTNIYGTQNVIDAANANSVERVLFTSSDKAVNPTNVMGTTKLMGERLITAANAYRRANGTIFSSTRFGNVLGSRGSVIPLFKKQISAGGPITLTDAGMTRFIMTLADAVKLVTKSTALAKGGEVFVTKMPVVRILDLANVMIEEMSPLYGYDPKKIDIRVIGSKAGEKLFEELINEEEIRRTIELDDYFVVTPAFSSVYENVDYHYEGVFKTKVDKPYNSSIAPAMSKDNLRKYLKENDLLNKEA
ncbi:MAG: polysaccharide biosynthesis protein [Leptospirales bacterium]